MLSQYFDACIWWKITRKHGINCSISKNQIQSLWMQILHKELKWLQDSSVEHLGLEAHFQCQWFLISAQDWMLTPLKFLFLGPVPQFKVFIVWLAWWSIAAYLLVIGKKMTPIKPFFWSDDKWYWIFFFIFRCFNPDMSITVRSAYGAEEGDNVSICYTDSLWPTSARRENLVYAKVSNP